jgi:hypothetical protein
VQQGIGKPMSSLAMKVAASFRHPGAVPSFQLDRGADCVYIVYGPPIGGAWPALPPGGASQQVRMTTVVESARDVPDFALQAGDVVAEFIIAVPDDAVLSGATLDYAEVFAASPERLKEWFEGKAILIGDARTGRDGPHKHPSGRMLYGFTAQAVATDALIREATIKRPGFVSLLGVFIHASFLLDAVGVVLGALLGWLVVSGRWRAILLCTVTIAGVAVSFLAYQSYLYLFNPVVSIIGVVLSTILVAWIVRVRLARLRQLS